MISVIIKIESDNLYALARSLQNLVSYAVDGFVQEVIVVHNEIDEATITLCEEAGCNLLHADVGMKTICENARGDWLLFMEPGAIFERGWADIVGAHANAGGGAAAFNIAALPDRPWWKNIFVPITYSRPLARGFLISKRQAHANLQGKSSPVELMRGLAMKRLRASIYPA